MISIDEPTQEIVVPVEGGRQAAFRYTEETINASASVATVFLVIEVSGPFLAHAIDGPSAISSSKK
jgi:hypothetical protein